MFKLRNISLFEFIVLSLGVGAFPIAVFGAIGAGMLWFHVCVLIFTPLTSWIIGNKMYESKEKEKELIIFGGFTLCRRCFRTVRKPQGSLCDRCIQKYEEEEKDDNENT